MSDYQSKVTEDDFDRPATLPVVVGGVAAVPHESQEAEGGWALQEAEAEAASAEDALAVRTAQPALHALPPQLLEASMTVEIDALSDYQAGLTEDDFIVHPAAMLGLGEDCAVCITESNDGLEGRGGALDGGSEGWDGGVEDDLAEFQPSGDTGTSSWDRPAAVPVVDQEEEHLVDIAHAGVDATARLPTADVAEWVEDVHTPASAAEDALPKDEMATNHDSKAVETIMDIPRESTHNTNMPAPQRIEDRTDMPAPLPQGWVEAVDSGKTYYYNPDTGESRWDRPMAEIVAKMEAEEWKGQGQERLPSEVSAIAECAEGSAVPLEEEDASNRPIAEAELEPVAAAASQALPVGAPSEELPTGWTERTDPASQTAYYVNETCGVTSLDRPTGDTGGAVEVDGSGASEHVARGRSLADDSSAREPMAQGLQDDPTSFSPPNDNTSVNLPSEHSVATAQSAHTEESMEDDDGSLASDESIERSRLPGGWVEATEEASGTIYYYNGVTGESSWERPVVDDVHDDDRLEDVTAVEDAAEELETAADHGQEQAAVVLGPEMVEPSTTEQPSLLSHAMPEASAETLPEGWIEATDASSGKVYYYNQDTGETAWDRPVDVREAVSAKNEDAKEASAQSPGKEVFANSIVASEIEEDEWSVTPTKEVEMDAVGTLEEADSIIEAELATPEPADKAATQRSPEGTHGNEGTEQSLQDEQQHRTEDDWIEAKDPSSGKVYYYNSSSGETSWTKPEPHPEEDSSQPLEEEDGLDGEGGQLEDAMIEEMQSNELLAGDAAAATEDEVPDKTAELQNEGVEEGSDSIIEAELTTPEPADKAATQRSPEGTHGNEGTEQSLQDEQQHQLKDDWIEAKDPSSGKVYYYNSSSGETSWTKPEPHPEEDSSQPLKEEDGLDGECGQLEDAMIEEMQSNELLAGDAAAATEDEVPDKTAELQNEVVDEGWTQVDHPPVEEADHPSANKNTNASSPSSKEMPEGWQESTDPSTGKTYYFNEVTGESAWERPVKVGVAEEEGITAVKQEDQDEDKASIIEDLPMDDVNAEGANIDDSSIPDEFLEQPSKSLSSLDLGVAEETLNGSVEEDTMNTCIATKPHLPDGWAEATDSSSGKIYYYNDSTGETLWTLPEIEHDVSPEEDEIETSMPNSDEPSLETSSTPVPEDAPTIEITSESIIKNESSEQKHEALPDGWIEGMDETSGKIYYYNESTGESLWERPSVEKEDTRLKAAADTECAVGDKVAVAGTEDVYVTGMLADDANKSLKVVVKPLEISTEEKKDSNANLQEALPEGWDEVTDPNSGNVYYFNETSGETTWDRPKTKATPSPKLAEANAASANSRSDTSTAQNQHRARPGHAIATFGFGGRLCVMMPQVAASLSGAVSPTTPVTNTKAMRRGPVVIHRVCELIPQNSDYSIPSGATAKFLSSPLIESSEDKMLSYLEKRSSSPLDDNILWNVVKIAAHNRGRLRNDETANKAIVDLLLAKEESKGNSVQLDTPVDQTAVSTSSSPTTSELNEVQELILRGERESAVSEALTQKNYALAILLATMCDRTTYQIATKRFADEVLEVGSPLHTATLLMSYNLDIDKDDGRSGSVWSEEDVYGDLENSWRDQLASIMSNQTGRWENLVLALGDRLLQLKQVQAAHLCYLLSCSPFGSSSESTTRLVLLGCDHTVSMNRMLMTPESIVSFERTEAFEWARRLGNRKTHITSLQPFKLRYAELLADFGREELARKYLLSIRSYLGNDEILAEKLKMLDDRICGSTGAEQLRWDNTDKDSKVVGKALNLVKSIWGGKSERKPEVPSKLSSNSVPVEQFTENQGENTISSHVKDKVDQSSPPREVLQFSVPHHPPPVESQTNSTTVVAEATSDERVITPNPSFEQASPAVMEVTPKLRLKLPSNPFSHNHSVTAGVGLPEDDNNMSLEGTSNDGIDQGPPSSAPPMFGADMSMNRDEEPEKLDAPEEDEDKATILSTPAQPAKNEKKKAPASAPAPRSGGWFSKLLGRDSESKPKTKVADVGEDMEAYYDDKLKRWIFPGDDPAEVAKPLAPPPMIPKKTDIAPSTPAPAASSDPLAALMAPPPSRGMSSNKKGSYGANRYSSPMKMGKKVPPSPLLNAAAPPTFAVFQPKPMASQTSSSDPSQNDKE